MGKSKIYCADNTIFMYCLSFGMWITTNESDCKHAATAGVSTDWYYSWACVRVFLLFMCLSNVDMKCHAQLCCAMLCQAKDNARLYCTFNSAFLSPMFQHELNQIELLFFSLTFSPRRIHSSRILLCNNPPFHVIFQLFSSLLF